MSDSWLTVPYRIDFEHEVRRQSIWDKGIFWLVLGSVVVVSGLVLGDWAKRRGK